MIVVFQPRPVQASEDLKSICEFVAAYQEPRSFDRLDVFAGKGAFAQVDPQFALDSLCLTVRGGVVGKLWLDRCD